MNSNKKPGESDTFFEGLKDGSAPDSTDTNVRYAAYLARARTIFNATHRYVAYTSDIGESFRPVVTPKYVTAAYGISWIYLIGDVSYEAWKARLRQKGLYKPGLQPWHPLPATISDAERFEISYNAPDWRVVAVQRGLFQAIASMGLPAFTIHSTVRLAGHAMRNVKNQRLKSYGPVGVGLAIVPALPYMFDEPVEKALDYAFEKGREIF